MTAFRPTSAAKSPERIDPMPGRQQPDNFRNATSSGTKKQNNRNIKPLMKTNKLIAILCVAMLGAGSASAADESKKDEPKTSAGVPAAYPLDKCVVSDEKLGEMGKAVKVTHNGTDVYLCCKSCTKDFNKDPDKYVKAVKDAEKEMKK